MDLSLTRLHRWHLHKWSLTCFCHLPSGSDVTVHLQNRCRHCCGHKQMEYDWIPSLSEQYCYAFARHRSELQHGEGLDRAGRHWGHCEDGEQSEVLHWISFVLPWRYGVTSKTLFYQALWGTLALIHSCLSLQRHDAQVKMTRRAVMFPGFSNWAGPSNSCRRLKAQSDWKWLKTFLYFSSQSVNLRFIFLCLSQLLPIMSDMEYLQDQHLLLSVKSCDGFESYGWSQCKLILFN